MAICIPGGVCTRVATHAKDSKRLVKSDLQVMQKEKRRRQGSDFRGLVERKPFEKLKESLMNQEAFKLLLDTPVDKIWTLGPL